MRTRFAPSPTGFLHVGGLRTALMSFLLARQTKGAFLLRIEDTDRERSVPGATEDMLRALAWAGIQPDEGVMLKDGIVSQEGSKGPYIQSERQEHGLYRKYADALLRSGHAYPCFCTPQRLEEMRRAQEGKKQAPMYDRRCLNLSAEEMDKKMKAGEPHVIRLRIPRERTIAFDDEIRGDVRFQGHTVDDQVLLKSDGFPTYHLAHVVDDHLMDIDMVIRGEEWLSSLPKHLLLFEYLGWTPPRYAHVPLLLNADRTKLSKRQNAVAVEEYREKGYLPEALVNFLALLGWNPGTTQEIFSLDELIAAFSLDRVQKAGAVFDVEKLDWLQGQWMRKIPLAAFADRIRPLVAAKFPAAAKDEVFEEKAALIRERITFFVEAPAMLGFFYEEPDVSVELLANPKQKVTADLLPQLLAEVEEILSDIPGKEWTRDRLLAAFQVAAKEKNRKLGQLLWPLRVAITGRAYSPGAVEVAEVMAKERGKEAVMERVRHAKTLSA